MSSGDHRSQHVVCIKRSSFGVTINISPAKDYRESESLFEQQRRPAFNFGEVQKSKKLCIVNIVTVSVADELAAAPSGYVCHFAQVVHMNDSLALCLWFLVSVFLSQNDTQALTRRWGRNSPAAAHCSIFSPSHANMHANLLLSPVYLSAVSSFVAHQGTFSSFSRETHHNLAPPTTPFLS